MVWLFGDKEGKLVFFLFPNIPLAIWLLCLPLQRAVDSVAISSAISLLSFIALIAWALLEITKPVNRMRRMVGMIVIVFSLYTRFIK